MLRVDADERKIGLSRKRVDWSGDQGGEEEDGSQSSAKQQSSTPPAELKGGVGGGSGPLIAPRAAKEEGEE